MQSFADPDRTISKPNDRTAYDLPVMVSSSVRATCGYWWGRLRLFTKSSYDMVYPAVWFG